MEDEVHTAAVGDPEVEVNAGISIVNCILTGTSRCSSMSICFAIL